LVKEALPPQGFFLLTRKKFGPEAEVSSTIVTHKGCAPILDERHISLLIQHKKNSPNHLTIDQQYVVSRLNRNVLMLAK